MKKLFSLLFLSVACVFQSEAQSRSADEYLQLARQAAFDQKDYRTAIGLLQQALVISPDYTDIEVFLGRIYYWNDQADSSMQVLRTALQKAPSYEEAVVAIADIAYFENDTRQALSYITSGLQYHPASKELLLRKMKFEVALQQFDAARQTLTGMRTAFKNDATVQQAAQSLRVAAARNKIGISYDHTGFDRQFDRPWQIWSFDYARETKRGSLAARVNHASRLGARGTQVEVDAYPRISKTFYGYVNMGYSPDMPVFAKYRGGASLYANLPASFEADAGVRYLYFSGSTFIYTLSAGKYYRNFWFNGRTYLTPSNKRISHSYTLTSRFYFGGADDYLSVAVGQGISPDERNQDVQLNSAYNLRTKKAAAAIRFSVRKLNVFNLSASYENVEYQPKTRGNQLNLSAGFLRRF